MPDKYHVSVEEATPRFTPVSKLTSLETGKCLGCTRCVRREACIYDVYQNRDFDTDPISIVLRQT